MSGKGNLALPLLTEHSDALGARQGTAAKPFGEEREGPALQLPGQPGWLEPLGSGTTSKWRAAYIPDNGPFPPFFSSVVSDLALFCSSELPVNSCRARLLLQAGRWGGTSDEVCPEQQIISTDSRLMHSTSLAPRSRDSFCSSWQCSRRFMSFCVAPPITKPGKPPGNQGLFDFHFLWVCRVASLTMLKLWRGVCEHSPMHKEGAEETCSISVSPFTFPNSFYEGEIPHRGAPFGVGKGNASQPCHPGHPWYHQTLPEWRRGLENQHQTFQI